MTHTEADIPRLNPARIEKMSGLGREGVRWAIADMTEERLLVLRSTPG